MLKQVVIFGMLIFEAFFSPDTSTFIESYILLFAILLAHIIQQLKLSDFNLMITNYYPFLLSLQYPFC